MTSTSKEFIERLYEAEKVLDEEVSWKQTGPGRFEAKSVVRTINEDHLLELKAKRWEKGHSYVLMHRNEIIRRWDFSDHYDEIDGGHKHKYPMDEYQADDPYPAGDVSTSDPDQGLIDFLDECTIIHEDAVIHELVEVDEYE